MNAVIRSAGDRVLVVELGKEINPAMNARVRALLRALERARVPGVVEFVPTYCTVAVHYRPERIGMQVLEQAVRSALSDAESAPAEPARVVEIPVLYDGPDLDFVAAHAGCSIREVVRIHAAPEYLVHMLGFTPGFAYLGGMDEAISTPRLDKPRVRIPAGSVGIAGAQTGVYPIDSPGGWRLIGHTTAKLYDPASKNPFLLEAGDRVRFVPVAANGD